MPGFWIFTRSISPPRVPTTVLTVFSCVASRNKRGKRALDGTDWGLRTRAYIRFPILILRFACRAGRTPRTASFADSLYLQNRQQLPYFELNPAVRRTARAGRLPLGKPATFASSLQAPGTRPAKTMLHSLVKAAKFDRRPKRSQEHNPFVLGAPPRAANASPSPRTAILRIALLALAPKLGPARRENRFRFSRPKNRHSPKLDPVLRPVSASLRLRYRSAGAARHPKDGRATEFSHTVEFFRAPGEILSKAQVALNDFPL